MKKKRTNIYVATESGKVLLLNLHDMESQVIFEDSKRRTMMGLVIKDDRLYFGGHLFLGSVALNADDVRVRVHYNLFLQGPLFRLFNRLHLESVALGFADPAFHNMTMCHDRLYVTATGRNEIWELDWDLKRTRCIPVETHSFDFNHLNNIFYDGECFYVCLMRYDERFGYGGYVKFNRNWQEIERKKMGWESHAFCVIAGEHYNLCASAGSKNQIYHPHKAGLMINGSFVFEHDPDAYYCKDFSMDDEYIYIVGGEVSARTERKKANAVIFILDKKYNLVDTLQFKGIGGFSGCRLPGLDYTNSVNTD